MARRQDVWPEQMGSTPSVKSLHPTNPSSDSASPSRTSTSARRTFAEQMPQRSALARRTRPLHRRPPQAPPLLAGRRVPPQNRRADAGTNCLHACVRQVRIDTSLDVQRALVVKGGRKIGKRLGVVARDKFNFVFRLPIPRNVRLLLTTAMLQPITGTIPNAGSFWALSYGSIDLNAINPCPVSRTQRCVIPGREQYRA